jgi:predicted ATPase
LRDLPSGTVTFLFTDIEGSTRLLRELGGAYADALADHRRLVREAFNRYNGFEVGTEGDAFFVVFRSPKDAVRAASDAQSALEPGPVRVRMGLHTGEPVISEGDYVGLDVHLAARIAACGHGGQVVLSAGTRSLLADSFPLLDLGEHRLKDFDDPVHLFQLGNGRFPPLRTISNTNLPRPASSFVGRQREVGEILSLLRDGARLLTMTGPGGTGKTRLAIEAASEMVPECKAGVFWVGLAPLREPALVSETIGQTLGAKDGLSAHIAEREMLLLLDNFEQVVDAAPHLTSLLGACPNLRMLVTSRERLRVQGEVEYAVPPLAESEAVQLFCSRSQLKADETIAELCRRLDDLPLAVELAAARTSVLSPVQVLERLSKRLDLLKGGRDVDPRQATLRATIEWSYDLLSDEEKALFARLAAFAGGCTLDSAEEVAGADLDVLQSLVDKSLVRHTQDRFWMLETVREYALERLEASDDADQMWRRHADHFLALAEEAEPYVLEESREWLDRLELEHDNLRAALDRLEASGDGERAMRLAGAVSLFWSSRGHLAEGRRRLEGALRGEPPTAARAKALDGAAELAVYGGDPVTAKAYANEALAIHRKLGDAWGAAYSMILLGHVAADEGDPSEAQRLFEASARAFGELGDQHQALWATRLLAWSYDALGDRQRARLLHEENLRRARAAGNLPIVATTLGALASYATDEGRAADAASLAREAISLSQELGDSAGTAIELCRCAGAVALRGEATTAARLLSSSEALREEMGLSERPWLAAENQKTLATIHAQLSEAAFAEAWEEGQKLSLEAAVALAIGALDEAGEA